MKLSKPPDSLANQAHGRNCTMNTVDWRVFFLEVPGLDQVLPLDDGSMLGFVLGEFDTLIKWCSGSISECNGASVFNFAVTLTRMVFFLSGVGSPSFSDVSFLRASLTMMGLAITSCGS